jgi:hypothetical protein
MRRQTSRNPLFRRRRFADDVIIIVRALISPVQAQLSGHGRDRVGAGRAGRAEHDPTLGRAIGGRLQPALASIRETGGRVVALR